MIENDFIETAYNEKVLIIPDVHNKFRIAEKIIEKENPSKIIFLGDYFDGHSDDQKTTLETALWLKESLQKPNRIHLLGNHDLSYMNPKFMTSGFTVEKAATIKGSNVNLGKLRHYFWIDDWLCTHAGLSNGFFKENAGSLTVKEYLQRASEYPQFQEKLYDCSHLRGGDAKFGGIVWSDYEEFQDIPSIKQIFGHTRGIMVRRKQNSEINSEHICLDTSLKNYAVYQNGAMAVKSLSDTKNSF